MQLVSKSVCSGCSACYAACPRHAIKMVADKEDFLRPQIDVALCVNCGLCAKVCPSLNRGEPREPIAVYAAQAHDTDLRLKSSSGGIFSLLARQVISRGGIVFGAGFDHADWRVIHKSAENEEELEDLRGSKYVQSDMGDTFAAVKRELATGREVLFVGTPCQVAGLRNYLHHSAPTSNAYTSNLLTADLICHAAPSPLAWRKYLEQRTAESASAKGRISAPAEGRNIRRISFRQKNFGWKRFSLSLRFANGKEYLVDLKNDPFLRGFLSELYNRPSCHNCQCRELRSGSDLTIADYWGVAARFPDMDDDCGTSLILVNTEKGFAVLSTVDDAMIKIPSDYGHVKVVNSAVYKSKAAHKNRDRFFKCVSRSGFDRAVSVSLRASFYQRVRLVIDQVIGRVVRIIQFRK